MQSGAKLFEKSYLNHTFVITIQLIQTIFISIFSIRYVIEVRCHEILFQTDAENLSFLSWKKVLFLKNII